jgi:hypothetical protein
MSVQPHQWDDPPVDDDSAAEKRAWYRQALAADPNKREWFRQTLSNWERNAGEPDDLAEIERMLNDD